MTDNTNKTANEVVESLKNTAVSTSEVDRLLATGERLLRNQQARLVSEKAAYETARTELLNNYQARLAQLERGTADELLQLQRDHEQKVSEIERLVAKLKAMREA